MKKSNLFLIISMFCIVTSVIIDFILVIKYHSNSLYSGVLFAIGIFFGLLSLKIKNKI